MVSRVEALVKPELLIWARETAGLTRDEAAKKVQVKPERLESWERGGRRPTINQLRKLSRAYKRPLAIFYLPEPPKTFKAMRDFRRLPGEIAGKESPQLRLEIRRAQYRREVAIDLYEALEGIPPSFTATANLSEDTENLASRIRELLGITYREQVGWKTPYEALNGWRSALEDIGVLVFQATGVEVSEMRGFSISDTPFPAIVVNIKDSPRGRIFTMLHEFVHIMIEKGGLCDLTEDRWRPPEEQEIEIFCNRVSGATLVPERYLLQEDIVAAKGQSLEWDDEEISTLAKRYNVSREVLLRRLLIIGLTTKEFYQRKREEFEAEYELLEKSRSAQGGYAPPHRMAISSAGHLFTHLVLTSYHQERITSSDLSELLEVRLKHMPKIEKEVIGHSVEFGAVS